MPNRKNRLFYTIKLTSSLLKEYKYNLSLSFEDCIKENLVVSLADSQMLQSIRTITGQQIDRDQLEEWYLERDKLKKSKSNNKPSSTTYKEKVKRIKELQSNIYSMMYIPQYITVVMDCVQDYEHMFKKGFIFNGKTYKRGSCSASQARVNTIVFIEESIIPELRAHLDAGRDLSHPLTPSKYNAYLGLYSSASKKVTTPRFCIIPDYCEKQEVEVSYSIETDWDLDDIISDRTLPIEFNRFDGAGLISPSMAKQWGQDLDEPYTPCSFCVRYTFTKGLVAVFDFVSWCEEENNGNYFIKDIWGNTVDLREIDVILTEGQTKLWDSWDSQESFVLNSEENGISWRVTKYAPDKDKETGLLNYQYLQTLNLSTPESIKSITQDTVDYIQGVSYSDINYTLLFTLGQSLTEESLLSYMSYSDNYWIKSLILNHNLLNDKYTKEKIRNLIVTRIEQACLGRLLVNGNYQAIIPDPYALCEHMFGLPVKGLLKNGEFYSSFWANKGISQIACARSPQTWRAEWQVEDVPAVLPATNEEDKVRFEKIKKYYGYLYSGIITNTHGEYTLNFAGSDFDYDILFTTNSKDIINAVYKNEKVTAYDVPKPKKKQNLTEEDLFLSDTFSFGQQIGPLTNISTSIYALLPLFKEGTKEHELLINRLKMCCVGQSKQIDKTKIGQAVKCIPKIWKVYQHIKDDDSEEVVEEKKFYNSLLVDKKPYFFKYKYKQTAQELRAFMDNAKAQCQIRFYKSLEELLSMKTEDMSKEEVEFVDYYRRCIPVIESNCVMNNICKYIESIDFSIKQKIHSSEEFDFKTLMYDKNFAEGGFNKEVYSGIKECVVNTLNEWQQAQKVNKKTQIEKIFLDSDNVNQKKAERDNQFFLLQNKLLSICPNGSELADYLVYLFYKDKPSLNKNVLWNLVGQEIYNNIASNTPSFTFPIKVEEKVEGEDYIRFLYEDYKLVTFGQIVEESDD